MMTTMHPKAPLQPTQHIIEMNGFQLLATISILHLLLNAGLTSADKQSVNIINQVGGAITLQCASRDNDLGLRTLGNQQNYFFDFHQNFFGSTLFWCNFQWQQRTAHIVVWKGHGSSGLDWTPCDQCVWVLKPNGFYRQQAGQDLQFVQGWQYPAFLVYSDSTATQETVH